MKRAKLRGGLSSKADLWSKSLKTGMNAISAENRLEYSVHVDTLRFAERKSRKLTVTLRP